MCCTTCGLGRWCTPRSHSPLHWKWHRGEWVSPAPGRWRSLCCSEPSGVLLRNYSTIYTVWSDVEEIWHPFSSPMLMITFGFHYSFLSTFNGLDSISYGGFDAGDFWSGTTVFSAMFHVAWRSPEEDQLFWTCASYTLVLTHYANCVLLAESTKLSGHQEQKLTSAAGTDSLSSTLANYGARSQRDLPIYSSPFLPSLCCSFVNKCCTETVYSSFKVHVHVLLMFTSVALFSCFCF